MAFKGLRFAGLEWKNITASKIMWVVIAAIAIMPLLYGALYLAAFQDPYARLNTVPVAVDSLIPAGISVWKGSRSAMRRVWGLPFPAVRI